MPRKVRRRSPLGGASRGLASSTHVSGGSRSAAGSSRAIPTSVLAQTSPSRSSNTSKTAPSGSPSAASLPSHSPSRKRCTPEAEPTHTVPSRPRRIDRTDCSPERSSRQLAPSRSKRSSREPNHRRPGDTSSAAIGDIGTPSAAPSERRARPRPSP